MKVKKSSVNQAEQPGRQPSIPPGFNLMSSTQTKIGMSRDRIGLGMFLMDSTTPVHVKVLELGEKKSHCEQTISNVRGLLAMLEEERNALDKAMNELIKETTQEVSEGIKRSNSRQNLEDMILSPRTAPSNTSQGLKRTGSSCNLEEMAVESLSKLPFHQKNIF